MKNVPRIFINEKLEVGKTIPADKDTIHYLTRVMRTDKCLVFNNGMEFNAKIHNSQLVIHNLTDHTDPSNDITFCFAPIKKTDDLINMVTQMGVAKIQPVITDRTVAHHIKWDRIKKIMVEAAEQSNRNSVPVLLNPIKLSDLIAECSLQSAECRLVFADERLAYNSSHVSRLTFHDQNGIAILIGPEGGFSEREFTALDTVGTPMSLGQTILRAEVAAVAALAKVI